MNHLKIKGIEINSQVKVQPTSDKETCKGALNRAFNAKTQYSHQDYWVGLEAGIHQEGSKMHTFAWVVILAKNSKGKSRTASFQLPEKVAKLIKQGKELGEAMDITFNKTNSKQKQGAIGILSGGVTDRESLYTQALINALIPIKKVKLFKAESKLS